MPWATAGRDPTAIADSERAAAASSGRRTTTMGMIDKAGMGVNDKSGCKGQEDCQRLRGDRPACTMCTIEVTIIERAPLAWLRPSSSAARTRSAADGAPARAGWAAAVVRAKCSGTFQQ